MKNTNTKPQPLSWDGDKAEWKESGFQIRAEIVPDDSPDTSWIGEYTDKAEPGVIVRARGIFLEDWPEDEELPERGREFRFFKPYAGGEKLESEHYRTYAMQDYERAEGNSRGDWYFVGIVVKAYKKGIRLGLASCWGFESDSGQDYLDDEARNIAAEAIHEARKNLRELCKA